MLQLIKVTGDSLFPEIRQGDFVLVSKIPFYFHPLKPGDVIVFEHPIYGRLIKRISQAAPDGNLFFVIGNHDLSIDSRQFGPVAKQAILGKVIWHISQPGR